MTVQGRKKRDGVRVRMRERERENKYLAQVAEMGKLPSEAALISNLRAFSAEKNKQIQKVKI